MAVSSRSKPELIIPKKFQEKDTSPQRNKIWAEHKSRKTMECKVPVIYYLSQNGQLEHPHFMDVPLSSPDGLYLRDVINRLDFLRGKGMASMYSWSSKRSYKNGYVWHDLSENDFIYPSHGHEYILKGSKLLQSSVSFRSYEPASSSETQPETNDTGFPVIFKTRSQSWSSCDPREYIVYKTTAAAAERTGDVAGKIAADVVTLTQTDEMRRRRRAVTKDDDELFAIHATSDLGRKEILPPSSRSSAHTVKLMSRSRDVDESGDIRDRMVGVDQHGSGRMKASAAALMHMITCGSGRVKDCGSTPSKDGGSESDRSTDGDCRAVQGIKLRLNLN